MRNHTAAHSNQEAQENEAPEALLFLTGMGAGFGTGGSSPPAHFHHRPPAAFLICNGEQNKISPHSDIHQGLLGGTKGIVKKSTSQVSYGGSLPATSPGCPSICLIKNLAGLCPQVLVGKISTTEPPMHLSPGPGR